MHDVEETEKLGPGRRLGNKYKSDRNSLSLPVETSRKPLELQTWRVHTWEPLTYKTSTPEKTEAGREDQELMGMIVVIRTWHNQPKICSQRKLEWCTNVKGKSRILVAFVKINLTHIYWLNKIRMKPILLTRTMPSEAIVWIQYSKIAVK